MTFRAGVRRESAHHGGSGGIERAHGAHRFVDAFLGGFAPFQRGGNDSRPQRFGQDQRVAFLDADVANNFVRMNGAGDRHAEFDLFVDDAMAADHHGAAFLDFFGAAFENLAENFHVHFTLGEANDIEAGLGLPAHGVNIAQRIGRGNLAKGVGIVDNGREEVHGVDDSQVRTQTEHPGVVAGLGADQHVRVIIKLWQAVQNLHEVGGAELSSSTRGLDRLRQSYGVFLAEHHRKVSLSPPTVYFNDGFGFSGCALSRRASPMRMVKPSRSKYSKSGIVYLRVDPIRSRNDAAVISPLSVK